MTEESSIILQGSISATAVAFLQAAVLRMIPYAAPSLVIIALDLIYGVKAAKYRGEKVRLSTALRRTTTKVFTYVCWLILASTIALAFDKLWLEWIILGAVYVNELTSVVGNYYETKGLRVSWRGFFNVIIGIFGQKTNTDTSGIDVGNIIEPIESEKPRDSKGRFVSKDKQV